MKLTLEMLRQSLTVVLMVVFAHSYAQVGINTTTPHPSSALDINSDTTGLLIPRVSRNNRINMPHPADGLLVFDTEDSIFFYCSKEKWYALNPLTTTFTKNGGTIDTLSYIYGRVGIGIMNPTERLQVIGNIRNSGNITSGGNVSAAKLYGEGAVPAGTIVMWSGNPNALPHGWALCDGNAGRPDLRGRFIVGYDNSTTPDADYDQVGEVGPRFTDADGFSAGTNTIDAKQIRLLAIQSGLPVHSHSINDPGHRHNFNDIYQQDQQVGGNASTGETAGSYQEMTAPSITSSSMTGITGTKDSSAINAGSAFENRPPYYVLAYIIKLPY